MWGRDPLKGLRAFGISFYPDPVGIGETAVLTYDI